ncbi:rhamnan synthesis F family protein [Ferrovum myxofaciens]|uniref:rhamnan synthesis F family protein n=1 Tax=Ferrovum myxofaciens TaxID=416213 RepID=UPI0023535041|nr:rhamnan synthesis F family protein [Ferrovum myxofaciens]MBU6994203.1 glycosyltransferase [Ferrovum myxofaciens]
MSANPKVSVILTSFNRVKYIRESIESVLSQTFQDLELIIWDDASSDNSWEIIGSYVDPRIKAYRNDETRRYVANRAIQEIATGQYIAIHHSDDVWEPEKLERQVRFLDENPSIGAVFCQTHVIDETGVLLEDDSHFYATIFDQPNRTRFQWLNFFFYHANALCHPSILIRKLCYEDCGVYRKGLGQLPDLEMWIRLCFKYDIHVLPEKLMRFRVRSNEANASGNRPETQARTATEFHLILENYQQIRSAEEMLAIFPEAEEYVRKEEFEPDYVLALLALQDKALPWARLFGISLLYRLLADPEKASRIKAGYDFDYRDFITLTGKYPVFPHTDETAPVSDLIQSQVKILKATLMKSENRIAELQQQLSEQRKSHLAIESSLSWRLMSPLRKISSKMQQVAKTAYLEKFMAMGAPHKGLEVDVDFYLKMYPDVARMGLNPADHYRTHGRREGRLPNPEYIQKLGDFSEFTVTRETLLIIFAEGSAADSENFLIEMMALLGLRYNLIALVIEGDERRMSLRAAGAVVFQVAAKNANPVLWEAVIDNICRCQTIRLALIDGIGPLCFSRMLARLFIPTISLPHDLISENHSAGALEETLYWSSLTLFPCQSLLTAARSFFPYLDDRIATVLRQGLSLSALRKQEPLASLHCSPRASNEIVVLGEGELQYQSGVDLFVACAAILIQESPNVRYRFIWIRESEGTTPDQKYISSVVDQIQRMGVAQVMSYFDKKSPATPGYAEADLYLLTTRFSAFSSEGLEAMAAGLPVVCFDQGSVVPEILSEEGLDEACVAPYLDIHHMADQVRLLSENENQRRAIGTRCRSLVRQPKFGREAYISALEKIACSILDRPTQIRTDIEDIHRSGRFCYDFASIQLGREIPEKERIHAYILSWLTGIRRTKPTPGFHPAVYAAEHGLANPHADSFADYIRAGCPQGPWLQHVIRPMDTRKLVVPENQKVALHLHVFYPHLLSAMLERLEQNTLKPDLFVSVPHADHRILVEEILANYSGRVVRLEVVPNRGRDIGPLLTQFGAELLTNYELIGHLHTKLSPHADPDIGASWYFFLLEHLLGGVGGAMADTIIAAMVADPTLGLVFPDNPHPVGWDRNLPHALHLAKRLGIEKLPEHFNFPVGTMFWARAEKLRPLFDLSLTWSDYPAEPVATDGTLLHAIERIFPFLPSPACARNAVVNVSGLSR